MSIFHIKGDDGFYHPETEGEIVLLVHYARDNHKQIRAHGSRHSVPEAIGADTPYPAENWAEGPPIDEEQINIKLDKYRKILSWDDDRKRVTVQSGIRLGVADHDAQYAGGPYH